MFAPEGKMNRLSGSFHTAPEDDDSLKKSSYCFRTESTIIEVRAALGAYLPDVQCLRYGEEVNRDGARSHLGQ